MYDIAITDGLCFIDRGFIQANIGIEGNRIVYVGRKEIKGEVEINAYDKLVLPGLFNAHTHVAMTLLRGYAEDIPLEEWLKKIWDAERKLTTKDIYWGSMLGILEMIKTGTTAFCDHYFLMDGVAEAVKESGIRAVLCYGMMDRGDREKGERLLKESRKFIEKWDGESGIIRTILGPHSIYMCSPEFLIKVKEHAKELKTLIHIHVSESEREVKEIKRKHGLTPLKFLNSINFLSRNVIAVHCVWIDGSELKILKEKDVSVVHNPVSNLKLASGIARISEMIQKGIRVCIGTDGAASNNSYNMFEEMKVALLLQKLLTKRTDVMRADDVLTIATENSYTAYGFNGGLIKKGKLADLILIDRKNPTLTPIYNPVNLIYSCRGCEVTHSIVNGKILLDDGRTSLSEEMIVRKAEKIAEKFV